MASRERRLLNIWDDTVDLPALLVSVAGGAALGLAAYKLALAALMARQGETAASLIKAYALLGGVGGCVLAAVLVGLVVKPKRIVETAQASAADQIDLLASLGADPDEERRALETTPPKVIAEMQQLKIHDLFVAFSRGSDAPKP
ncbi:hypothetical protein [Caulobacter sp. RHG1]|uniref:hypothetical protein n=1 Tax=Caulobacter sp. (strain RHG1) TaxID=2545762 RepID=UPI0015541CAE|nr:hypothetical protein [Caulobacter sp. RHG1]NQE61660.1 hypothetical protein [Caulobacter sp. RHG1]